MQNCMKIILLYGVGISATACSMTRDRRDYEHVISYIQEVRFVNDTINELNEITLDMSSEIALQHSQRRYDIGVITWPFFIVGVGTTCATMGIACLLSPLAFGWFG